MVTHRFGPARLSLGVASVSLVLCAALVGCSPSTTPPASSSSPVSPQAGAPATSAAPAAPVTADGPVTLQSWGDVSGYQTMWDTWAKTFPAESANLTFKAVSGGDNDFDSYSKFRMELSAGTGIPDIVAMNASALPEFAASGVLEDLTSATSADMGNLIKSAQAVATYDGKVYGVPFQVNEKLWYYRTDLFQQAGIDPTQVKTQADFIAAGKALQKVDPKSYIWNLGPSPDQYIIGEITSGNGAQYSTQNPCALTIGADPGLTQAFQAIKDIRSSGVVDNVNDWTPEWQSGLADGTIASLPIASWMGTFLMQYAPDLKGKWGVAQWPEIGGATGGSEAGGALLVIPAQAKNKAAAIQFLTQLFLTTQGNEAYRAASSGWIPLVTDVLTSDAVRNDPYFGTSLVDAYLAAADTYQVFPFDPSFTKETTVIQSQLVNYLASNDATPEKYLQAAQTQLQSQVGCPYSS